MSLSSFSTLLKEWQEHSEKQQQKLSKEVSYYAQDDLKIRALAETYSLSVEAILADLIHHALFEIEEKMPYVPGKKVIRIEEGAKIYDDIGPMAQYLEALKKLQETG